jgi:hypothetical protein
MLSAEGLTQDGADDVFGACEVDADTLELTASQDGPANLWFGGFVGTHCVNDDVYRHSAQHRSVQVDDSELSLDSFFGCQDGSALVLAALAAGAVGQLALVAVGALGEAGGGEEVVAAALGSPLLGVAPFWIRHCSIPFEVFDGCDRCAVRGFRSLRSKQNLMLLKANLVVLKTLLLFHELVG